MSRDIVVFLGPTLPRDRASSYLRALYLPPAEQGSVFQAARALQPRAIVLIDGAFAKVPAVRHKEILMGSEPRHQSVWGGEHGCASSR